MQRTLGRFRDAPASARISAKFASQTSRAPSKPRLWHSTALVHAQRTSRSSADRNNSPGPSHTTPQQGLSKAKRLAHQLPPAKPTIQKEEHALGQVQVRHEQALAKTNQDGTSGSEIQESLRGAEEQLEPDDFRSWERLLIVLRHRHGGDGVWSVFESMEAKDTLQILANPNAEILRDEILKVALGTEERLATVVQVAIRFYEEEEFQWPELYIKVEHYMLEQERYDDAVRWHLYLGPRFMPEADVFGALLSSFIGNPNPEIQNCLTTLYIFSNQRQMYDYIIPAIYNSGQSKLARRWRRRFVYANDLPTTLKSQPFLRFLASYYPAMQLTETEMAVAGLEGYKGTPTPGATKSRDEPAEPKGIYSDSIVARWFASSWTSVEFAINLVHRLGLRSIGPRSLQSLALREPAAKDIAARISQLEKLGVQISSQIYCKVLVAFAKGGKQTLLADLVRCDIHPDEFEDAETRQMILKASIRSGDEKKQELFQGVEQVIGTGSPANRLNLLLGEELDARKFGQAKVVLDRMEALKVDVAQTHATTLMKRAFWMVGYHPSEDRLVKEGFVENHESRLNRAIEISRQIAFHDVALPLKYWRILLYNLGRRGRFEELEQLSLEICQLYSPPYGGLMPIHQQDLPLTEEAKEADKVKLEINRILISEARQQASSDAEFDPYFAQHLRGEKGKAARRDLVDAFEPTSWEAKSNSYDSEDSDAFEIMEAQMSRLRRSSGEESGKSTTSKKSTLVSKPQSKPRPEPQIFEDGELEASSGLENTKRYEAPEKPIARNVYKAKEKEYIPTDLPFKHREHPIQKIFDPHLQRSIIRWTFDQSLLPAAEAPRFSGRSLLLSRSDFDVARGVRLLARLRDKGVLIEKGTLKTTVLSRIAVGQLPGRHRAAGRDHNELSASNVKRLVEAAWGEEFLGGMRDLNAQMEKVRAKTWERYPRMLSRAVDDRLPEVEMEGDTEVDMKWRRR